MTEKVAYPLNDNHLKIQCGNFSHNFHVVFDVEAFVFLFLYLREHSSNCVIAGNKTDLLIFL